MTFMTPNLWNLTLDLPSVTSADLTQRSSRSQLGEKTNLRGALATRKQKKTWKKAEKSFFYFPSLSLSISLWGQEYPTCSQFNKMPMKHLSLAGTHRLYFTTTKRTHFASSVKHPPLYSTPLWLEGGGSFKGMKLIEEAGLKPLECCQNTEDKTKRGKFKGGLSLWAKGRAHRVDHIRGKAPPSFLSKQPWRKPERKQNMFTVGIFLGMT